MYVYGIEGITRNIAKQIRNMHKKHYTRFQMFNRLGISSVQLDKYLNRYITNKNLDVLKYKKCFDCGIVYPNTNKYYHYQDKPKGKLRNICKTCRNKQRRLERGPRKSRKIYNDDTLKLKRQIQRKCKRIILGNIYWEKIKADPIKLEKARATRRISNKKRREKQIIQKIEQKRAKNIDI